MIKKVEIKCRVMIVGEKYQLILIDRAKVLKELVNTFLVDSGQSSIELEGVIKQNYETKSKRQLGYYFSAVVKHIGLGLENEGYKGLNEKDVDEFLRRKFLTITVPNEVTGEFIEYQKTLSGLDKEEMTKYIDECINFAQQDLNWYVPKPEEQK